MFLHHNFRVRNWLHHAIPSTNLSVTKYFAVVLCRRDLRSDGNKVHHDEASSATSSCQEDFINDNYHSRYFFITTIAFDGQKITSNGQSKRKHSTCKHLSRQPSDERHCSGNSGHNESLANHGFNYIPAFNTIQRTIIRYQ